MSRAGRSKWEMEDKIGRERNLQWLICTVMLIGYINPVEEPLGTPAGDCLDLINWDKEFYCVCGIISWTETLD